MLNSKLTVCFATVLGNCSTENESKANLALYNDFFTKLYDSTLPVSIHFTGSFLGLLQSKAQAFDDITKELLAKKQIELIGGAYYSPLFPLLNSADMLGQLEMYDTELRKCFSVRSKIAYLPFSAWNSSIISIIKKSRTIEYCLLDKRLFQHSDLNELSPVCLEDFGRVITVIPYTDFDTITETPQEFYTNLTKKVRDTQSLNLQVIFLQPQTLAQLLTKKDGSSWIDGFLALLQQDKTTDIGTIPKILKSQKMFSTGFIESNFIFNGSMQNASVKKVISDNAYPYNMYKRLLYVSTLINQVKGDKQKKAAAERSVWKAQNSHFFLKSAFSPAENRALILDFYKTLILAEKAVRDSGKFAASLVPFDFNFDGVIDYVSQTKNLNVYVDLIGGKISEYDFLPANKNFCISFFNTPLSATAGMFIDFFLPHAKGRDFFEAQPHDTLANSYYQCVEYSAAKKNLLLKLNTTYNSEPVSIKKHFSFNGDSVSVQYILKNDSSVFLSGSFCTEFTLFLFKNANKVPSAVIFSHGNKSEVVLDGTACSEVTWLQIADAQGKTKLNISSNEAISIAIVPVKLQDETLVGAKLYLYWHFNLIEKGETEKLITVVAEKIVAKKDDDTQRPLFADTELLS